MIFKFEPLYFQRVWGGRTLEKIFRRQMPKEVAIGESWDLVDRKDFQSVLISPQKSKITIRELLKSNHPKIMGPGWDQNMRFPVLVKWLDCAERLSLQVHPPKELAGSLKGEPKTENWYVAHTWADSGLFVGLKLGTTKENFLQALVDKKLESVCHRIPSSAGDSILVESGRMHAIDGGNLILEIQQNSDTTFRVYDWERVGTNGTPRELHIDESLKCIDFNDFEPTVTKSSATPIQILAECDHFRIRKFKANANEVISLKASNEQCMIINPINSDIKIRNIEVSKGELGLSPYEHECEVRFKESGDLIVTDNFHKPVT